MKKPASDYERHYKKYYMRKKKNGWKTVTVLGPVELIEAIKDFTKEYKSTHDLYTYKRYADS